MDRKGVAYCPIPAATRVADVAAGIRLWAVLYTE